jgi:cobalt-zinc-cadmium efflux system membrane fusion protein
LSPAARARNPVKVAPVELAKVSGDVQVVGTVTFHEDHFAVVGPLVAGRVSKLIAGVGDQVKRGQVIAEIESSEVGQSRAELVSAQARYAAADANLKRETDLAEKKISSSREREVAHAQWVTEQAGVRAAVMRLRAIGLTQADIDAAMRHDLGGRVQIRAPISGTVIERKVTLGQAVERATDAFKIADTSHVWVTLDLYEKDLAHVRVGQEVETRTESRPGEIFRGRVAFIVPVIDPATRTATVRLEFPNPKGVLSAGQLVTARIVGDGKGSAAEVLVVPRSAVEQVEGKTAVFVQTEADTGFERRNVVTGVSGGDKIEIRQGLKAGELVAVDGAFLLKSELLR